MSTSSIKKDVVLIEEEPPRSVLQSVVTALNQGNISRAVGLSDFQVASRCRRRCASLRMG